MESDIQMKSLIRIFNICTDLQPNMRKEIFLLYGSQSGNAESIAKDVADSIQNLCSSVPILVRCMTLNSAKTEKVNLKGDDKVLLIVCSTTGNGDAPENAEAWWRTVKLRSAAKDLFAGTIYSVLGLGDTNYDKFCYMGKQIDKRISELGAQRCLDIHCADEATNMEEIIEAWKAAVFTLVQKIVADHTIAAKAATITEAEKTSCENAASVSVEDVSTAPLIETPCAPKPCSVVQECLSSALLNIEKVALLCGITNKLSEPVDGSNLPKQKVAFNDDVTYTFEPQSTITSSSLHSSEEYSAQNPYQVTVKSARFLTSDRGNENSQPTQWDTQRKVIHVDLDVDDCKLPYQPGDSIGVCCPNPNFLVELLLQRLQKSHENQSLTLDTPVRSGDTVVTLGELLSYRFDLCSVPKKAAVLKLVQFCSDPAEARQLQHLCSKGDVGKTLWAQFIEVQRVGMGELLCLLQSCQPTLSQLCSCLSLQIPRYYSIASSSLSTPGQLSFAFSVVHYVCGVSAPSAAGGEDVKILRYGVCTSFLENALRPWLRPSATTTTAALVPATLRIFHKPSISFRLPGSVSHPLILIGPGTGVAPFLGFLSHRDQLKAQRQRHGSRGGGGGGGGQQTCTGMWRGCLELDEQDLPCEGNAVETFIHSIAPGPICLYFGCRNESDYLYKDELHSFLTTGTLTHLRVAMSRVEENKVYVTHRLREDKAMISRLILEEGGYVYICGDGNHMAKDVLEALQEIIAESGFAGDRSEAAAYIKEMKTRQRYLQDIWS